MTNETEKTRILFVGEVHSSHAQSWISLLDEMDVEVRCFGIDTGMPAPDFAPLTYAAVQRPSYRASNRVVRSLASRIAIYVGETLRPGYMRAANVRWLARIVASWRPHIVHTLGLNPGGALYLDALAHVPSDIRPKWVAQVRGGPDLQVFGRRADWRAKYDEIFAVCDAVIADNAQNYAMAAELGCNPDKFFPGGIVPGTGGIDLEAMRSQWSGPPSRRERLILWPKAYEHIQSKGLPVLEGIRVAWDDIKPCRIICTATDVETQDWLAALPEEIRACIEIRPRISRATLLELMCRVRVVLAPSLLDGIPNSLYEAMAAGAVPIFSPLETMVQLFKNGENVLYARNLYPGEIATQLRRAMVDDEIADAIAATNRAVVARMCDRKPIGAAVRGFYAKLVERESFEVVPPPPSGVRPHRKLKILFVGEIHSTHAQSWIETLPRRDFRIRAFALSIGQPSPALRVPVYCTAKFERTKDRLRRYSGIREFLALFSWSAISTGATYVRLADLFASLLLRWPPDISGSIRSLRSEISARWLGRICARWRPDIVQAFGLSPAGEFVARTMYLPTRSTNARFVLQLRGGSDLAFSHADPERIPAIAEVLRAADALITDNAHNFEYTRRMGLSDLKAPRLIVPGTGGIDVDGLARWRADPPSGRRLIVIPKAYESPWSKCLPILEALKIAWSDIQPCSVEMLMAVNELPSWVRMLPDEMRAAIRLHRHIPRGEVLRMIARARVVLAPSLVDGTPNVMWEAMALGALPIVSPLPTIVPVVAEPDNVLFADNLSPEQIADRLVRAMRDDALIDHAAANNLGVVNMRANRDMLRPKIAGFYYEIGGSREA